MTLEERVKRLESLMTTSSQPEAVSLHTAIRRDLAAEEVPEKPLYISIRDREIVANLRTQVAELTRELDQANGALSVCGIDLRAALAHAMKAERERDEFEQYSPCGNSHNEEACGVCVACLGVRCDYGRTALLEARAQITDRDETIAEARERISGIAAWLRENGHNYPPTAGHTPACFCCQKVRECDTFLAGQPAPAAPQPVCDVCGSLGAKGEPIGPPINGWLCVACKDNRDLRAEVARLEALRARCEAWLAWTFDNAPGDCPEKATSLLRDLRAGRAANATL